MPRTRYDASARLLLASLAVVALAAAACSSPGEQSAPRSTEAPSTASPTPSTTSPPTASSPTRTSRPTRTVRARPDTVGAATQRETTGLVRITAVLSPERSEILTGMVLTADGQVLTSNHGVAGASALSVTVENTGRRYSARLRAADPRRDIALLQLVGASGLTPVALAPRDARVGERVTVVGVAAGRSGLTAASGTTLALDQTLVAPAAGNVRAERLTGLTFVSADVSLGESGGPTYDARRRVVGMTTAAVPTQRGPAGVAIPVSALRRALAGFR